MSAEQVDEYLRGVEEPKRSTLAAVRRMILEIVPDAQETISYRVLAFRVDGAIVAGFAAFRDTSATWRLAARFWRSCPTENQHSPALCAEFCRVAARAMRGGVLFRGDRGPERKRETTRTACGETAQPACKRMSVKGPFDARVTGARR